MNSYLTFIKERFNPLAYMPMIISFLGAHFALAGLMGQQSDFTVLFYVLIAFGVTIFFLRLRIYDEIKDYSIDLKIHPKRPLPSGLITKGQLIKWEYLCAILTLLCFSVFGYASILGIILVLCYSWLMYKEFFISGFLRSHMTIYAVTHTFVALLLSLAIYSAISNQYVWQFSAPIYYFALCNWLLFNIFEFGRKSFSSTEENPHVNSYSKIFGRYGAVTLVISMGLLGLLCLNLTPFADTEYLLIVISIALIGLNIVGWMYSVLNNSLIAQIYRIATSLYLICVYIILNTSSVRLS